MSAGGEKSCHPEARRPRARRHRREARDQPNVTMKLSIKQAAGTAISIDVELSMTVLQVKEVIEKETTRSVTSSA